MWLRRLRHQVLSLDVTLTDEEGALDETVTEVTERTGLPEVAQKPREKKTKRQQVRVGSDRVDVPKDVTTALDSVSESEPAVIDVWDSEELGLQGLVEEPTHVFAQIKQPPIRQKKKPERKPVEQIVQKTEDPPAKQTRTGREIKKPCHLWDYKQ